MAEGFRILLAEEFEEQRRAEEVMASFWFGCWLTSQAGKEQTPAAASTLHKLLRQIAFLMAIAYAAFVFYVSATYPHSWIEKLQMLPLCIVALTAPIMLCTIMIPK